MQLFSHTCDCVLSLCTVYLHNNTIKKSLKISQWQSEAVIRRMDNAMATNKGQIYKQMTYKRICTQFTIKQYNKVREGTQQDQNVITTNITYMWSVLHRDI